MIGGTELTIFVLATSIIVTFVLLLFHFVKRVEAVDARQLEGQVRREAPDASREAK